MGKIIKITFVIGLFFLLVNPVHAELVAGSSARINYTQDTADARTQNYFLVKRTIRTVLERYNSPLVDEADSFARYCMEYQLDCYLLPSIAGLESTFGKFILPNSYNPFGWGGGYILFDSWDEGIGAVAKGLRNGYVNKGAVTIEQIAPIYSESKTWAPRINYFVNIFKAEEEKQLFFDQNKVNL